MEGVVKVGETLTAKVIPDKATVTYQWTRSDTEDGTYKNITGATNSTYILDVSDAGKYIKVKAMGYGDYKGIVTSQIAVGPVLAATISWATVNDAEIDLDSLKLEQDKLAIDDAVVNRPIYIVIKAESEANKELTVRNIIVGQDVDQDSFDIEVVKGYVFDNGQWQETGSETRVEYGEGHFYYDLDEFTARTILVTIIKLTPKVANTFTIDVYMVGR